MTKSPLTHHPLFWDSAIALALGLTVSIVISSTWFLFLRETSIGYQIILLLLAFFACFAFLLILYGSFIEPKNINLNKKSIQSENFPSLTIAVIADFHCGPYKQRSFIQRAVDLTMQQHPDLILMPGDFIYNHRSDLTHLEPLKYLKAPLGVFAVMGNHDSGHHVYVGNRGRYQTVDRTAEITNYLRTLGITVLRNEIQQRKHHEKTFMIAGIDDVWMTSPEQTKALAAITSNIPTILLTHNPDVLLDPQCPDVSFIICGHTNGGQMRLPFIGSIAPIPNQLGRRFDHGIFHLANGSILAITHGIGESLVRSRLFCPPEILLLQIN